MNEREFRLRTCDNCHNNFLIAGDNWYRIERMHDDRVGTGPMLFDSRQCATAWLQEQMDFEPT